VQQYYDRSYKAGLTPNPCVECNRYVKWEAFIGYATEQLGVDYVATGHYVNLARPEGALGGKVEVLRASDPSKDQTYMLARVKRPDLDKALFPLGLWQKKDALALALELGITTPSYKESQDVCFVTDGQANYLKGALGIAKGAVVDLDTGAVVGEHEGHWLFTRGQRKGVGVAAGRPVYVIETEAKTNTVFIGDKHHLESDTLLVEDVNWLVPAITEPTRLMVKFRYNTPPALAVVEPLAGSTNAYQVRFELPQQAITAGQIAAFYDATDTQLLGGGYIESHLRHAPFDASAEHHLPELASCSV
jgi:tRNA-uridine 2-sulfurtransferase